MRDTVMVVVGLVMALGAAAMLVWTDADPAGFVPFAVVGLVVIGVGARHRGERQRPGFDEAAGLHG